MSPNQFRLLLETVRILLHNNKGMSTRRKDAIESEVRIITLFRILSAASYLDLILI